MNSQISEGKWKVLKGKIQEQWGELTEDELEKTKGNIEQIAGAIQTKYGDTLESSQKKINGLLEKVNKSLS